MQDSDDYFDDDFTLTEKDLEAIDEAENRHLARTLSNVPSQPPIVRHTPPPAKRQKTNHVWNQTPNQPSSSREDFGEMPEIMVQGDGSYAVYGERGRRGVNSGPGVVHRPSPRVAPRPLSRTPSVQGQSVAAVQANKHRPQPVSRASSSGIASGVSGQRGFSPAAEQSRRSVTPVALRRASGAQIVQRTGPGTDKEGHVVQELQILRAQLAELRKENEAALKEKEEAEKAAKEAQDAQFAKLGEASILRSNMERVKQQHTSEVTRLKATIEAAEAEKAQLKRTMKEELERIRTQNIFRQHEMETAQRTPWVARIQKTDQQRPTSPVPLPSQIRQWNSAAIKAVHTPRKSNLDKTGSPEMTRRHGPPLKKVAQLPGFQNAFEPGSPVKPKGKGKQRETRFEDDNSVFFVSGAPSSSPTPGPARDKGKQVDNAPDALMEEVVQESPQEGPLTQPTASGDVVMADETVQHTDTLDEPSAIEPLSLKDEVHDIVTSHTFAGGNHRKVFTIQMLLNLPASGDPLPPTAQVDHGSACSQLIETLWATSKIIDEDSYISAISESLVLLVGAFNVISFIPTLSALFNLLQVLSYSVTPFANKLLSPPNDDLPGGASLIATLCNVILDQLDPDKGSAEDVLRPFAKELFGLIDTMSYLARDDLVASLALIPRSKDVLATLLSSRQPLWLIERATKTLALLVTHMELYQDFLTAPEPSPSEKGKGSKDPPLIPHIEQMSRYLRDGRDTPDVLDFKSYILVFMGTLSIAHRDSLSLLFQSQNVVPSIIVFLADVSTAFWEEREDLLSSPELVTKHIVIMVSTTLLLHHMMCSSPSRYDVARLFPLKNVKNGKFNGLIHKCTVTFSRLAFADPPDWIDPVQKEQLEQIPDMAKELLQLFHGDPEMEVLWSTFQLDQDVVRRAPADEDEEAMLAVPDDDE